MTYVQISDAEAAEPCESFDPQAAVVRYRTAVADIEWAGAARRHRGEWWLAPVVAHDELVREDEFFG